MTIIATPRLILRKFTPEDLEALFALLQDEVVNTFLPWFPAKSQADAEAFYLEKRENPSDCRKTLGELERAKALSNFNRAQRHVRWAREDFCGGKSHFPEQKSFPCSFCARKSERFQQKLVGVAGTGELVPPSTSLSKSFLTSCGRIPIFSPSV